MPPLTLTPIGVVRTPFVERASAPRQGVVAPTVAGTVKLEQPFEFAVSDLEGWSQIWLLTWLHKNEGSWRSKVLPPRSTERRGVFATRSPHRPNPIGLSAVELVGVRGLTLDVRGVDLLDGTPVLDIKPYVPYADAFPNARTGWLEAGGAAGSRPPDPDPGFAVAWSPLAEAQLAWLRDGHGIDLRAPIEAILALGPTPHPYRRIKKEGEGFCLAHKAFRVNFRVQARLVTIDRIRTGYRASELKARREEPELSVHKAFAEAFSRPTL